MNIEMLAVNIAVVSLVFVPYLIFLMFGQRESKKITSKFNEEARKHGLTITEKETWNLNVLGLDSANQKLLFVQRRDQELFVELIDLSAVKLCRLSNVSSDIIVHGKKDSLLQKLYLEFVQFSGLENQVCLFDYEQNFTEDFEMKRAEKWNRLINNCLSLKPVFRKAA